VKRPAGGTSKLQRGVTAGRISDRASKLRIDWGCRDGAALRVGFRPCALCSVAVLLSWAGFAGSPLEIGNGFSITKLRRWLRVAGGGFLLAPTETRRGLAEVFAERLLARRVSRGWPEQSAVLVGFLTFLFFLVN